GKRCWPGQEPVFGVYTICSVTLRRHALISVLVGLVSQWGPPSNVVRHGGVGGRLFRRIFRHRGGKPYISGESAGMGRNPGAGAFPAESGNASGGKCIGCGFLHAFDGRNAWL